MSNPLVIFDCDGTLVDSQHVIIACMVEAFLSHGLERPEPDAVRRIVGLSLFEAVARLMPGVPAHDVMPVAETYRDAFKSRRAEGRIEEPLFPGCLKAIEYLDEKGVLLGVATGKSRRGLDAVLAHHGLADRFVTLQTADTHPSKPHPSMVKAAIAEAGATPGTAVIVGDTSYDMEMARAAGARAVGVAWGYHPSKELEMAGAELVMDRFEDLHGVLDLLGARPVP